jgi:hypothetical protein
MDRNSKTALLDLVEQIPLVGKAVANLARQRGKWKSKLTAVLLILCFALACLLLLTKKQAAAVPDSSVTNSGNNNNNSVVVVGSGNSVRVEASTNTQPVRPPEIPVIQFETLGGLPPSVITNRVHLRMHSLVVRNLNDVEILNFCSRLQLPEPIEHFPIAKIEKTVGVEIGWRSLGLDLSIEGTAGRSESGLWIGPTSAVHFVYPHPCYIAADERGWSTEHSGGGKLTGVWELTVNRLPPKGLVSIDFFTSDATDATNYIRFAGTPHWQRATPPVPRTNELRYFFEGEFQYANGGKFESRQFFVPIMFEDATRTISSLSPQTNVGKWRPVTLDLY